LAALRLRWGLNVLFVGPRGVPQARQARRLWLKRHQDRLGLSDRAVEDVLDGLCARGECREVHFLWRPQLKDPKDDHILELAVAAGGADIVTHNVNDFAGASAFGLRIITPAELLGELR